MVYSEIKMPTTISNLHFIEEQMFTRHEIASTNLLFPLTYMYSFVVAEIFFFVIDITGAVNA